MKVWLFPSQLSFPTVPSMVSNGWVYPGGKTDNWGWSGFVSLVSKKQVVFRLY